MPASLRSTVAPVLLTLALLASFASAFFRHATTIVAAFAAADSFSLSAAADDDDPSSRRSGKRPAYLIIEARIADPVKFAAYAKAVPSIVSKYGGEYLVLGGQHTPLEGEWGDTRLVLHKWPEADSAMKFWKSEEYAEVKELRDGTGEFRIMLLDGLEVDDFAGEL